MKKYLFNLPPRDPARKPYAAGLTPEADAWAKAKGAAVQQLYDNLRTRKATVEDALRFLLGYLQKPEEAAAAFGLEEAADAVGTNPGGNPHNSLINEPAQVGETLADGKEGMI